MPTTNCLIVTTLFCVNAVNMTDAQRVKVVSISVGNASDLGNPPVVSSIAVALELLSERYPEVLANYTYHYAALRGQTGCADGLTSGENAEIGLAYLYRDGHFFNNGPTIILASACVQTFQSVANYAGELGMLALGFTTADPSHANKTRFPTLLSFTTATPQIYASKLLAVLDMFNWRSIAIVLDKCSAHATTGYSVRVRRECQGVSALLQERKDIKYIQIDTDSNGADANWATAALLAASNFSRIILACTLGPAQNQLAVTASDLGMTNGQYVFIHLYETDVPQEYPLSCREADGSYNKKLCAAFAHYLMVRSDPVDWSKLVDYTDRVKARWNSWFYPPTTNGILGSEFMAIIFEALEAVAQVLEEVRERNSTEPVRGQQIAGLMFNRLFNLTSRSVKLTEVGTRVVTTHIQVFSRKTRSFQSIFVSDSGRDTLTRIAGVEFPWGGQSPPLDRPLCGIHNELCLSDNTAFLLSVSLGVGCPVMFLLIILIFLERRRRMAHAYEKWLIKDDGKGQSAIGGERGEAGSIHDQSEKSTVKLLQTGKRTMHVRGIRVVCCVPGRDETMAMDKIRPILDSPADKQSGSRLLWLCNTVGGAELSQVLTNITNLQHPNINALVGLSLHSRPPFICQTHRERGSLLDLWQGGQANIDWNLKTSLISDLVEGLGAIHRSSLKLHGNLKASKCVIDSRFCLRIDDLGHEEVMSVIMRAKLDVPLNRYSAPELYDGLPATPASDVFALAVIAGQLLSDSYAADSRMRSRTSTLMAADRPKHRRSSRGNIGVHELNESTGEKESLQKILNDCLHREATLRPSISKVRSALRPVVGKESLLDSLLHRLRNHTDTLEVLVYNRQQELLLEQRRCEDLLNEMLPKPCTTAEKLSISCAWEGKSHPNPSSR
ncbi:atrial natriuretic peptide receptor 1-like isoform X2 [Paramacrobiotus metropolitanus]|uniref:atrial natriuretic peptide receptor 1-like isoform X2 n=1 Tax=Paramacrobiotus metropolitanus TaxID=2943436 RepID=UPI002445E423|nr:atrial natriuretic peptide receptor 1-like isoform X2 [Paramacrobiotus metropolitanus]